MLLKSDIEFPHELFLVQIKFEGSQNVYQYLKSQQSSLSSNFSYLSVISLSFKTLPFKEPPTDAMLYTSKVLKSSTLHCTGHRFASMAATETQSLNPLPLQPFLEHKY